MLIAQEARRLMDHNTPWWGLPNSDVLLQRHANQFCCVGRGHVRAAAILIFVPLKRIASQDNALSKMVECLRYTRTHDHFLISGWCEVEVDADKAGVRR